MNELSMSSTELAIWIALLVSQGILCLCAFRKGLLRRLPFFSAYVFVAFAENASLLPVALLTSYSTYYYTFYWAGRLVSALALATLLEFAWQIIPGLETPRLEKAAAWLLAGLTGVVLFAGSWPMHAVANERRIEVGGFLAISFTFFLVATYARSMGLKWSRLLGGVSITLGLLYLFRGINSAIIGHYPPDVALRLRPFADVVNLLAVISWTVVVLSPWGEHKMTEEDLLTFQQIVGAAQQNVRRFIAGGTK